MTNAGRLGDVPLYVHYPQAEPRMSNAAISITSIAPTIWHYLDQPIPGAVTHARCCCPKKRWRSARNRSRHCSAAASKPSTRSEAPVAYARGARKPPAQHRRAGSAIHRK